VQPGYSGSPVFVIRRPSGAIPERWLFRFIGLCEAYPRYFSPIYREVRLSEIPDIYVSQNPGFTKVIGVTAIEKLLGR